MRPEIKKRIEQIQKGVAPEGYKKTKVGIVPDEWDDANLGSFGEFYKGKGINKEQLTKEGKNCVRYGEIYTTHDTVIKEFTSFVNEDVAYESTQIFKGDILFAGSGETPEDIGKSVAFIGQEEAYAGGDIVIFRQNRENTLYLAYLFNGTEVNRQRYKYGQGHSIVHLYMDDIKRIIVALPLLPEQEKIAEILSIWDKAIELKERLIAEKKQQKKWLMQNLLTSKKRLPGFEDEWQKFEVGKIISQSSNKINPIIEKQTFKCIELEHIESETGRLLGSTISSIQKSNKSYFAKGDVLFGKLRPYLKKFHYAKQEGVCSS